MSTLARGRRTTADESLDLQRELAMAVPTGTITAAFTDFCSATECLGLVRRQLAEAKRETSRLLKSLSSPEEITSDQSGQRRDAMNRSSLPRVNQSVLATLLAEAPQPVVKCNQPALRCPCGVPAARRGRNAVPQTQTLYQPDHPRESRSA